MPENKFPTEMVTLPSKGYFYPENSPLSKGEVEMKYMTAREEDILTSPNLIRSGVVLDKLIESLLVDKKIKVDDLLLGDKNGLIVASRILAYGKMYDFTTFNDAGEEVEATVDLTTLKDKEIDFDKLPPNVSEFPFVLPNSKREVIVRFLTHRDEKEIEKETEALKKVSSTVVKTMTSRMKRIIGSVDGNSERTYVNEFVDKELLSVDALELRKYLNSINPDINLTTVATFPDGDEQEVAVEITAQFFWPSA